LRWLEEEEGRRSPSREVEKGIPETLERTAPFGVVEAVGLGYSVAVVVEAGL
jgi:hypothetical protein